MRNSLERVAWLALPIGEAGLAGRARLVVLVL
jgi:hypothetical protein